MRRAAALVALLLLALAAMPADAGQSGKQRIARVQKGHPVEEIHLFWASMNTATDVLITRFPGGNTKENDEFEIVDQSGYVGRARVQQIERVQGGCPNVTFDNAYARLVSPPPSGLQGTMMVALLPSRRDLRRARVMLADEVRSPPQLDGRKYIDLGLDLDGDNDADLVRMFYDCPPANASAGYSYAYCMEIHARDKRAPGWKLVETVVVPECY